MSLFDVLKYGSTNFDNLEEIRKLPIDIVNVLWYSMYPGDSQDHSDQVNYLYSSAAVFRRDELDTKFRIVLKNLK